MITFFRSQTPKIYLVKSSVPLQNDDIPRLEWLFSAKFQSATHIDGHFIGPRKEMITPWSTNAVDIVQNMGISGVERIEEFVSSEPDADYDRMLQHLYDGLSQSVFDIALEPEPTRLIHDISAYNQEEGLALSGEEITYLENVSKKLGRELTDSEVFGFSQVNSEHCRHKIFNGTFIIDGETMTESLFQLIKKTSRQNPNRLISAYKDNVAFVKGPVVEQFAPVRQDIPDYFVTKNFQSVLSLKAETHNFPTTVEPFNGAATGSGGEIRDRMAGGRGSIPLAGTAVYMTSYPRVNPKNDWEKRFQERAWLYQSPLDILIKASNGASDFGNKFGQPLICGSLLTFEHINEDDSLGYDKVIMLAGGIGFGKEAESEKEIPQKGDKVVVLGGDNYRIGMGGGAVSSVATGEYGDAIELNAIQRSNPEMQKRVYNSIRAMTELDLNPIVSIHDHGAGGHLNCLSELLEATGGTIDISKLPKGDPTLSDKEIIGNESQERMGLILHEKDLNILSDVTKRERAPYYEVGEVTGNHIFEFANGRNGSTPIHLAIDQLFGSSPKTILEDQTLRRKKKEFEFSPVDIEPYLEKVLRLEAVACKDWLTNKVDRCVTGKVAQQQTVGPIQLPLSNVAVMSLDYQGKKGVATSIGHAPIAGVLDPAAGSILSVAEALTNLVWAPIEGGLNGVSLSANWMWPAKNPGENARLYAAVKAISDFACELGINIPTGKDSLSMSQKYADGKNILSPGTVIVSTVGEVTDLRKVITPLLRNESSTLVYIDFSKTRASLGGSSLMQCLGELGGKPTNVNDPTYFATCFNAIQDLLEKNLILSGHDISSGGLITTLLEMCFSRNDVGLDISLSSNENSSTEILFAENPGVVIQVSDLAEVDKILNSFGVEFKNIGRVIEERKLKLHVNEWEAELDIDHYRDIWLETSHLLDFHQTREEYAEMRFRNYKDQSLNFTFPSHWEGKFESLGVDPHRKEKSGIKAAIIREQGVNGDREMAWCLHLAGFDVKDVHMTDLMTGRETLEDINFIVFVGGFSNSDVLGSAKGWAGAFLFNEKAKTVLDNFYKREDTLSLGVCNGCQLMMELGLLYPEMEDHPKMHDNASGKFECHFVSVDIPGNNSIMLSSLAGTRLGIWVAHGEGRFILPGDETNYNIVGKYTYPEFPGNPNDSDFSTACLSSFDGRHLALMPHLERSLYPWNWAYYHENFESDEVSPWIEAFTNAREWLLEKAKSTSISE